MRFIMNRKKIIFICIAIFAVVVFLVLFFPSSSSVEPFVIRKSGNQFSFLKGNQFVFIDILESNIIKINYRPDGASSSATEITGRSSWKKPVYTFDLEINPAVIRTDDITVAINKKTGEIIFSDAQGNSILNQKPVAVYREDEVDFTYTGSHVFYGLDSYGAGETSSRKMLIEDGTRVLAGKQGDAGAPLVWTNGFGILVDSEGGDFKLTDQSISFSQNTKTDLDYYFISGKGQKIMESVFKISGTSPMFPKWSCGFTNSEWGMDQKELIDIVNTYRAKKIPIDNYTLDFDWKAWGEDNYGEFRWNSKKFPDGSSGNLKRKMDGLGIKLTGIFKPRILVNTIQGAYAKEHGYFWSNRKDYNEYFSGKPANDIDFYNAAAGAWYFDKVKKSIDTGIAGYWNDEADELGDNLQHLKMQKTLYLGQRGYNDKRVWSINRNFFLGAQKYAYGLWSGDISTGFESMRKQRETMLTAVNLGAVKWTMDTGGFNGNPDAENYTRWMQFSAFTPMFRVHATNEQQRQPWVFGPIAEKASKEIMQFRYEHIPYIYSYERRAYETGIGLVKPLFYDYPDDEKLYNYIDGWFFGDHLIVFPVVDQGVKEKKIYLPEGNWINYFSGKIFEGGREHIILCDNVNYSDVPLFIKAGAVIPSHEFINYVGEKRISRVKLDIFPSDKLTTFNYYDDDGLTYSYEEGVYFKQVISVSGINSTEIKISDSIGTYNPDVKQYNIIVHRKADEIFINDIKISSVKGTDKYGDFISFYLPAGKKSDILIK